MHDKILNQYHKPKSSHKWLYERKNYWEKLEIVTFIT